MKLDVFISYSSVNKTIADAICHNLESRNIRCWYAPRDILPGMDWTESIIEAIEDSRLMILVFSKESNQSVQVKREVERAVHHNKIVIPFRIENVLPTKSMEYLIGMHHWLDAFSLMEENAAIKKLIEAVQQTLGIKAQEPKTDPDSTKAHLERSDEGSFASEQKNVAETESVYVKMLEILLVDGNLAPRERDKLAGLAQQLGILNDRAHEIEKSVTLSLQNAMKEPTAESFNTQKTTEFEQNRVEVSNQQDVQLMPQTSSTIHTLTSKVAGFFKRTRKQQPDSKDSLLARFFTTNELQQVTPPDSLFALTVYLAWTDGIITASEKAALLQIMKEHNLDKSLSFWVVERPNLADMSPYFKNIIDPEETLRKVADQIELVISGEEEMEWVRQIETLLGVDGTLTKATKVEH